MSAVAQARSRAVSRWFAARLRDLATPRPLIAVLTILAAPVAMACPVCFGNATGPQAEGMNSAIIFLLGVVGFVQIGFAAMFIAFWRRGRAARRHRDSFRVIHGG